MVGIIGTMRVRERFRINLYQELQNKFSLVFFYAILRMFSMEVGTQANNDEAAILKYPVQVN